MRVLAGDIGGTKTAMAIVEISGSRLAIQRFRKYPSGRFRSLEEIVAVFLQGRGRVPRAAGFGVAGPVRAGRSRVTKLPWVVDERRLRSEIGIARVRVVNDFVAAALGIPYLKPRQLATLRGEDAELRGPIGLIGAGTGLGQAALAGFGGRARRFRSPQCRRGPPGAVSSKAVRAGLTGPAALRRGPRASLRLRQGGGLRARERSRRPRLPDRGSRLGDQPVRHGSERSPLPGGSASLRLDLRLGSREPRSPVPGDRRALHRGRDRAEDPSGLARPGFPGLVLIEAADGGAAGGYSGPRGARAAASALRCGGVRLPDRDGNDAPVFKDDDALGSHVSPAKALTPFFPEL